jgi:hypothetical protein
VRSHARMVCSCLYEQIKAAGGKIWELGETGEIDGRDRLELHRSCGLEQRSRDVAPGAEEQRSRTRARTLGPAAPATAPSSAAHTAVAAAGSAPGGADGPVEEGGVPPVRSDTWAMKAMARSCAAAARGSAASAAAERKAMKA